MLSGARGTRDDAATAAEQFAEDLGRLLGTAQRKANEWLGQRKNLADHLTQLRDTANELLQSLGADRAAEAMRGRRGRGSRGNSAAPAADTAGRTAGRPRGRKKKRTMSPEARAKIAAAQRARWAKQRREG